MKQVVVALELGFGTTSICSGARTEDGKLKVKTYSSMVAHVDAGADLSAGLAKRDSVKVLVGEAYFEVGPDAHLGAGNKASRILNNQYIESSQYRALFLGGLAYSEQTEIDLLVLGVPVNANHQIDFLKTMALGKHVIEGVEYTVKDVWVIVQPLGGVLSYSNTIGQKRYDELRQSNMLSIDCGYGTIDFLVSRGLKINESRSGAVDSGMGVLLQDVWDRALKPSFPRAARAPLELIDNAFWRTPGRLSISGRSYSFPKTDGFDLEGNSVQVHFDAQPVIDSFTNSALTAIRNKAGTGEDIDHVIVFGGSSQVFLPAVKSAYPDHNIVCLPNAQTAVCEGMYLGGVQYLGRR